MIFVDLRAGVYFNDDDGLTSWLTRPVLFESCWRDSSPIFRLLWREFDHAADRAGRITLAFVRQRLGELRDTLPAKARIRYRVPRLAHTLSTDCLTQLVCISLRRLASNTNPRRVRHYIRVAERRLCALMQRLEFGDPDA